MHYIFASFKSSTSTSNNVDSGIAFINFFFYLPEPQSGFKPRFIGRNDVYILSAFVMHGLAYTMAL